MSSPMGAPVQALAANSFFFLVAVTCVSLNIGPATASPLDSYRNNNNRLNTGLDLRSPSISLHKRSVAFPAVDRSVLAVQISGIVGAYVGSLIIVFFYIMFIRRMRTKAARQAADAKTATQSGGSSDVELKKFPSSIQLNGNLTQQSNFAHLKEIAPASPTLSGKSSRFVRLSNKFTRSTHSRTSSAAMSPERSFAADQDAVGILFAAALMQQDAEMTSQRLASAVTSPVAQSHNIAHPPYLMPSSQPASTFAPSVHHSASFSRPRPILQLDPGYQPPVDSPGLSRNYERNERMRRTIAENGELTPDDLAPLSPLSAVSGSNDPFMLESPAGSEYTARTQPYGVRKSPSMQHSVSNSFTGATSSNQLPLRSLSRANEESTQVTIDYAPTRPLGRNQMPMTPFSPSYDVMTPITPINSPLPTRQQLRQLRRQFNNTHIVEDDEQMVY